MKSEQKTLLLSPTILTIFGLTGDLSIKKIIPSLWFLFHKNRLPDKLKVIGFSRKDFTDQQLSEYIKDVLQKHDKNNIDEQNFQTFISFFIYQQGIFEDKKAFQSFSETIYETEKAWGVCSNKLFYLAVPPSNYKSILTNLALVKLNEPCGGDMGWSRILIEKPFGVNLNSSRKLQSVLSKYYKEEQIYRIDHYLFKEIIQGIENFRFSNNLFENIWDNTTIDNIELKLYETIGVEDRGNFYDSIGAWRDVGQNHLLSMLAAITMEYQDHADMRKARAEVLSSLLPWTKALIKEKTYRAQFEKYRSIKGVKPESQTETYFAFQTELLHPRWKGVPITIKAGKYLAETRKEIIVTLKHPAVCHLCTIDPNHGQNKLIFRLAPNNEVIINFWTKKPGFDLILEERSFSFFLYEKETQTQYVEEYAKVLHAAMNNEQALFISFEEIEAEWKFADPITEAWQINKIPLISYQSGTTPLIKFLNKSSVVPNEKEETLEIGVIGLGKMGANLAQQMISHGYKVYGFNRSPEATRALESSGFNGTYTLSDLVAKLTKPRLLWLMVPYQAVESVIDELLPILSKGDVIIDGGNSPYKQSMRLSEKISKQSIHFLDVGVSGGPAGALNGACLMVGGDKAIFEKYEPLFKKLSVSNGYAHVGSSGAGHFVKMIHNGIEYGMMQSIAEGFAVLKESTFLLDLPAIAQLYNHGSVITSRLVSWLSDAYTQFGTQLDTEECCSGQVAQSGEGLWTVQAAKEINVPTPIIEGSVEFRKQSQANPSYTGQILTALRHQFGGHHQPK